MQQCDCVPAGQHFLACLILTQYCRWTIHDNHYFNKSYYNTCAYGWRLESYIIRSLCLMAGCMEFPYLNHFGWPDKETSYKIYKIHFLSIFPQTAFSSRRGSTLSYEIYNVIWYLLRKVIFKTTTKSFKSFSHPHKIWGIRAPPGAIHK